MTKTSIEFQDCRYWRYCPHYKGVTCSRILNQEICLHYLEYSFEERELEGLVERETEIVDKIMGGRK